MLNGVESQAATLLEFYYFDILELNYVHFCDFRQTIFFIISILSVNKISLISAAYYSTTYIYLPSYNANITHFSTKIHALIFSLCVNDLFGVLAIYLRQIDRYLMN